MGLLRRVGPLLGALLVLVAVLLIVSALGSGGLAPPPRDPWSWGAWAQDRDGVVVVFSLLRLVVLALGWYCLAVLLLLLVVDLTRAVRLVPFVEAVTLPGLRHLVARAVGLSLAVGVFAPTAAALALPPTPALADAPDAGTSSAVEPPPLRFLPPRPSAAEDRVPPPSAMAGRREALAPGRRATPPLVTEVTGGSRGDAAHVVRPGESLWSIARVVVERSGRTAADEDEVADYWSEVVEHNRDDLPDPENPDLIFPGQVVRLPGTSTSE